jgi:hypothetical protein
MRSRVSGDTPGRSLIANETAADETPARRATSAMVGLRRVPEGADSDSLNRGNVQDAEAL